METLISASVADTRALGARLAKSLKPGDCLALVGTLGSGKTELVRGLVEALRPGETVRSPSFALVYSYQGADFPLHHFDFYRLNSGDELTEIGWWDYVSDARGVCLVEWADMFPEVMPKNTLWVRFSDGENEEARSISISAA